MPIKIERQPDLIKFIMSGQVTADELYLGVDSIYESADGASTETVPPKKVLWDITQAILPTDSNVSAQLREFSSYATERGKERSDGRVAVVSPADVQFGIARMTASLAEVNQAAYSVRIFRNSEAAMEWLSEAD